MLIRHQVLLTDWQTKYLKNVSKKLRLSFSETIRQFINSGVMADHGVTLLFALQNCDKQKKSNFVSKMTFEAHKKAEGK